MYIIPYLCAASAVLLICLKLTGYEPPELFVIVVKTIATLPLFSSRTLSNNSSLPSPKYLSFIVYIPYYIFLFGQLMISNVILYSFPFGAIIAVSLMFKM